METHFRQGHAVGYAAGFKAGQLQEQALQVALTQKLVGTSSPSLFVAPLPHAPGPSLAQLALNIMPTQGEDATVNPLPVAAAAVVPKQAGLPRSGAAAASSAPGAVITTVASNGTSPQTPRPLDL